MSSCHVDAFFNTVSVHIFRPFLMRLFAFLSRSFKSSCVLRTAVLQLMVSSPSAACLLTHVTVSSTEQKFLVVTCPAYAIFPSRTGPLALCLRCHHQTQGHLGFLLRDLLLGILCKVLHLTCRSVTRFELIFMETRRSVSRFSVSHGMPKCPSALCSRACPGSIVCLCSFVKISGAICVLSLLLHDLFVSSFGKAARSHGRSYCQVASVLHVVR